MVKGSRKLLGSWILAAKGRGEGEREKGRVLAVENSK